MVPEDFFAWFELEEIDEGIEQDLCGGDGG
jgi:hypothetical protein